jgi:hypothetical protein
MCNFYCRERAHVTVHLQTSTSIPPDAHDTHAHMHTYATNTAFTVKPWFIIFVRIPQKQIMNMRNKRFG